MQDPEYDFLGTPFHGNPLNKLALGKVGANSAGTSVLKVGRAGDQRSHLPLLKKALQEYANRAMKRPRELQKKNARLKQIVAERTMDISILKEVSQVTSEGGPQTSSTVKKVYRKLKGS
jgi:hypothetical protein